MAVKQLLGRIVGTEEQITYMNGQLPERLASNFLNGVATQGENPASLHALKMYAYHGHREMMYALGAFLGIEYDIDFPGLPKGAIPPATTLFFELHYVGELDSNGRVPNPWTANHMTNPYEHRMVKPEDMPPPKRMWGEKEENEIERNEAKVLIESDTNDNSVQKTPSSSSSAQQSQTMKHEKTKHTEKQSPPPSQSQGQTAVPSQSVVPPPGEKSDEAPTERRQDRPATATPTSVNANNGTSVEPTTSGGVNTTAPSRADAEAQQAALAHPVQPSYPDAPAEREAAGATGTSSDASASDRRTLRRLLQTTTPNRTGENELNGHRPHRNPDEILPHPSHATGSGSDLVKIPQSRMPDPPMKDYVVRAYLWHPCDDASGSEDEKKLKTPKESKKSRKSSSSSDGGNEDCPAVPVKMTAICDSYECTLADFRNKMEARVQRTGTWDKLCGVKHAVRMITADVAAAKASVEEESLVDTETIKRPQPQPTSSPRESSSHFHVMRWIIIFALGALLYFGIVKYRAMRSNSSRYRDDEDYITYTSSSSSYAAERAPLNRVF